MAGAGAALGGRPELPVHAGDVSRGWTSCFGGLQVRLPPEKELVANSLESVLSCSCQRPSSMGRCGSPGASPGQTTQREQGHPLPRGTGEGTAFLEGWGRRRGLDARRTGRVGVGLHGEGHTLSRGGLGVRGQALGAQTRALAGAEREASWGWEMVGTGIGEGRRRRGPHPPQAGEFPVILKP